MRHKLRVAGMFAVIALLGALMPASAGAGGPPQLPASFYGTVTIGGTYALQNAVITAGHDGVVYASRTVFLTGDVSYYRINVPEDNPDTPERDGGTVGETIEFTVNGIPAHETATWISGSNVDLPLTTDAPTPTATPSLTPMPTVPPTATPTATPTLRMLRVHLPLIVRGMIYGSQQP